MPADTSAVTSRPAELSESRATRFASSACRCTRWTMHETVTVVGQAMRQRRPFQHVALNVAKFVKLRSDPELKADVQGADIVGVDGMGILVGARLLGTSGARTRRRR